MKIKGNIKVALWSAVALVVLTGVARAQDQTQDQTRERIHDRIQTAPNLAPEERAMMHKNLDACFRAGVTNGSLSAVFPGETGGGQISARTMLRLQERVIAASHGGLPMGSVLAKIQEARMKGVPEGSLDQVCERMENHVREAQRIMTQAKADGIKPVAGPGRERQMIGELAQQMWRGTSAADVDELRMRAREGSRDGTCTLEDLTVACETATRLREEGVESRRAVRVTGDALAKGYGAEELRQLQYMMVYRHREHRDVTGLMQDFEHCLMTGMNSDHMYEYMMEHGWMGPGDMHGPAGSHPMDDQGHGPGHMGDGSGGHMDGDGSHMGDGMGGTGSGGSGSSEPMGGK